MAYDLTIKERTRKALYQPPFRLGRSFLNFEEHRTIEEIAGLRQEYAALPDQAKPFGYAFQTVFGPDLLFVETQVLEGVGKQKYDPDAQIWGTSHHRIDMSNIWLPTQYMTGTVYNCSPDSTFDTRNDSAC
ncbi:hypothetical protein [Nonomuraea sp. NEAU-A123]|uniref:hypothetical protein n=1 Tax=Nonomuraea sp. NEAU-A123 TaxID=2839649 RepID=UPI001BE41CDD|nr:hypothetical protein [Nonomuraea sp. NEAU-A123]MBT2233514.1 hypothetical protein [Nonomuraea sp. NEAU-A123]